MSASQLKARAGAMIKVAEKLEKNAISIRKEAEKLNDLASKFSSTSGRGPGRPRGKSNGITLPDLVLA